MGKQKIVGIQWNSLKTRLSIVIGLSIVSILALFIWDQIQLAEQDEYDQMAERVHMASERLGDDLRNTVRRADDTSDVLASVFQGVKSPEAPLEIGRDAANLLLRNALGMDDYFEGVSMTWEPDAFDEMDLVYAGLPGYDKSGRFSAYWSRDETGALNVLPLKNIDQPDSFYQSAKSTNRNILFGPHVLRTGGDDVQVFSTISPISQGDTFFGAVAIHTPVARLQDLVDTVAEESAATEVCITNAQGVIVAAAHQPELIGESFQGSIPEAEALWALRKEKGESAGEFREDNFLTQHTVSFPHFETHWYIFTLNSTDKLVAQTHSLFWKKFALGAVLCAAALVVIWFFVYRMTRPLKVLAATAERVADGDLSVEPLNSTTAEIRQVSDSFQEVIGSLREVTSVCESVSRGDFTQSVHVRSEHDVLGESVNRMADNLRAVVDQARRIASGDFETIIEPHSEADALGNALAHMTRELRQASEFNARQNWLKTGQTELNDLLRGDRDIELIAGDLITYLAKAVNAATGALYVADNDSQKLHLISSYAFTKRKDLANEYDFGERLLGQAAKEKTPIVLTDFPDDYLAIGSGLGKAPSNALFIMPCTYNDTVTAVIELASFNGFTDLQMEFVEVLAPNIAVAVNSAQARAEMTRLLNQTQEQADRLQVQQEELQQANEELEERARALEASDERLRQQQEELQQTNEELEERSRELESQRDRVRRQNEDLAEAREELEKNVRQLEETSRYKSEFLANMSHELRTPLNSMLVLSQMLAENKDNTFTEKQAESVQTIHDAGLDLLRLINEILDLSKVEAGKITLNYAALNLHDLAEDSRRQFAHVAEERNLEFVIELEDGVPTTIMSDQQRVEQITKNLLSNAFKFTHEGCISLRIFRPGPESDMKRLKGRRDVVGIAVEDTGIGIPEDKRLLIFEAFQQADGATTRKYGGTGLGLSISRELANILGGEIRMTSEENKGSTFTLYLPEEPPNVDTATQPIAESAAASTAGGPKAVTGAKLDESAEIEAPSLEQPVEAVRDDRRHLLPEDRSILIIEDDANFAKVLADMARERDFKCIIAGDGESGLHLADYYRPNAIMLDVNLPGIDGWGVMARLKENLATRHIPVHFVTAADRADEARTMGASGYLTKPVSVNELRDAFQDMERIVDKTVKDLLVVADSEQRIEDLRQIIGNGDVLTTAATSGKDGLLLLENRMFDCVVVVAALPDMKCSEFLEELRDRCACQLPPVVVYEPEELLDDEAEALRVLAAEWPVREVSSPERLLDETVLFLHRVEANMPEDQRKLLQLVHDKDAVLRGKQVLLTDDDMRNVFALSSVLEQNGLVVTVAKNGREAVEQADNRTDIDLILMDIMMPEMDGYAAMQEIRKRPAYAQTPIIALTAKAMKGDRKKCIDAGASDYLAKPVDVDKLLSLLRVWLY